MRIALPVLVCLALVGASAASAAEPDATALRQEVQALREMVLDLQKRVSQLEGRSPAGQASPAPGARAPSAAAPAAAAPAVPRAGYVSPEAALRVNWSKVKENMDESEVTSLLGPPSKKLALDGRTVWYYYYPATGGGSVFFGDAGRVSSSQSPFGLGW